jgi:shikimate dehydrogenase
MRQFGLIGFPLGHSWSESYFTEKFRAGHIQDCAYSLFPMQDITVLPGLLRNHPHLCGLNVTIPHKETVIPLLDRLSESATAIGAVNTIQIDRIDKEVILTGHNTDAYGFEKSLAMHGVRQADHALVLGSGGASKAVCHVLKELGWNITLVSRKRNAYANDTSIHGQQNHRPSDTCFIKLITYDQIDLEVMGRHLLIVNTTPLGMHPETGTSPDIPYHLLSGSHILYDLVYNPEITLFMRKGIQQGCRVIGGLDMLRQQADKAWEIWSEANRGNCSTI